MHVLSSHFTCALAPRGCCRQLPVASALGFGRFIRAFLATVTSEVSLPPLPLVSPPAFNCGPTVYQTYRAVAQYAYGLPGRDQEQVWYGIHL